MKIPWKIVFSRLCWALLTALFLVPAVLFLVISLLFSCNLPAYGQQALLTLGWAAIAAVLLAILLPRKWRRWLLLPLLAAAVGCGGYCGWGLWRDSIPTVSEGDRYTLLSGYQPFTEGSLTARLDGPAALRLSRADCPRLDGATALYPVYAAFVEAFYPEGDYPFLKEPGGSSVQVACTGTVDAYERLISGETDLIFAAAPSQEQLDLAASQGMELHLTPIGREAFVFFVNSNNPVNGLTVEQVQGIYSGAITNWSQVGGKDQSIRPFQRMENSGSQTALLRLMDGLPLIEPEQEDRVADMGGIISQVADYRNYQNAVGFSFRFYSTQMVQNGDIRLLALDGVFPTKEAIRERQLPHFRSLLCGHRLPGGTARPPGKGRGPEQVPGVDPVPGGAASGGGERICLPHIRQKANRQVPVGFSYFFRWDSLSFSSRRSRSTWAMW